MEVMGLELVLQPFGRYRDEIRFFLASVADRITDDWPDPAGLGPDVMVESRARGSGQIADIVRKWLTVAEEALLLENNGKERAAVEKWRELFGWRMTRRVSSAAPFRRRKQSTQSMTGWTRQHLRVRRTERED